MNYYKRPIWQSPFFYILLILFIISVSFFYWSITRQIPNPLIQNKEQKEIILPENTTPILISKEGKVRIIDKITKQEREININEKIITGISIKTFDESSAIISFGQSSQIRLSSNTEIQIMEAENNTITIKQIYGQTYNRIENDSINYAIETLDSRFISKKSVFNLLTNSQNSKIELSVFKNQIDAQITKSGIPINSFVIKQGTTAILSLKNSIKDIAKFNEISPKKIIEENEWLRKNIEKDNSLQLDLGILSNTGLPKEIILNAYIENKNVYLNWKLEDGLAVKGFRILMSKERQEPTYPEDINRYISNNEATTDIWKNLQNGKYYFRIGLYDGKGSILKYSNSVTLEIDSTKQLGKIELTAYRQENEAVLEWKTQGIDPIEAFYLISSNSRIPIYPTDTNEKIDSELRTKTISNIDPNQIYNFRICVVTNETCSIYSNNAKIEQKKQDGSITLSGFSTDDDIYIEWITNNLNTNNLGYRILLSENANPTLETGIVKSIESKTITNYTWNDLQRGKNYYISVCEYLGDNKCGIFSNTISIKIQPKEEISTNAFLKITAYYTWGKLHINWEAQNIQSINGFYVMVDEKQEPSYPESPFHNIDKTLFYDAWTVEAGKTYYIKVCAQKNNSCEVYSNLLKVNAI